MSEDDVSDDPPDQDAELGELLRRYEPLINVGHRIHPRQAIYNFRVDDNFVFDQLVDELRNIYRSAFKINLNFSFVLRNIETGELRFFYASNNTSMLDRPMLIHDNASFRDFLEVLRTLDILEWVRNQRPNSKWVFLKLVQTLVTVTRLNFPIGCSGIELPHYITVNEAIVSVVRDRHSGEAYDDNLCLFRCLALHQGEGERHFRRATDANFELYLQEISLAPEDFDGVDVSDLYIAEELFQVSIVVYSIDENGQAFCIRRSAKDFPQMYVNLYENHFSFIRDIKAYCDCFVCSKCDKIFNTPYRLDRHERTCDTNVKHKFPGGTFRVKKTVFEELEDLGFEFEPSDKFHPYFSTWDLESFQVECSNEAEEHRALQWLSEHVPASISVASNVPSYESAKCFVTTGDEKRLVSDFVDYLLEISDMSYRLLREKYEEVFSQLEIMIRNLPEDDEKGRADILKLKKRFDLFLFELPTIGFNSSRYDINVIRKSFFKILQSVESEEDLETNGIDFVVKRNNAYMCLKTARLKFVDICNYLAPGYSYADFLKAYGCSAQKGFFPYEWFDNVEKLEFDQLPPHEAFFSALKNANITEDEYRFCSAIWRDKNMESFRDYLIWYNNLDVEPFVEAIEKMFEFYQAKGLDLFKDGISVPGLVMKYMFSGLEHNTFFSLFREQDKDLYYSFKNNIVGGPSIIFNRYHEQDKTFIRNGTKPCKKIWGADANALYLWALAQKMPCGYYVRRKKVEDFKRRGCFNKWSIEWLDFVAHRDGLNIVHAHNQGEHRIGRYPVDGFDLQSNTVFEFQGCYWHGHRCTMNTHTFNERCGVPMEVLFERTGQKVQYLEERGFKVVQMWECGYRELRKTEELQAFLATYEQQLDVRTRLSLRRRG